MSAIHQHYISYLTIHIFFFFFFFFFNDTATTEIYTLSLHDALPIFSPSRCGSRATCARRPVGDEGGLDLKLLRHPIARSEEHTSELQSPCNLVCRLLLEKKKKKQYATYTVNTEVVMYEVTI